jgi:hypothetical protein
MTIQRMSLLRPEARGYYLPRQTFVAPWSSLAG